MLRSGPAGFSSPVHYLGELRSHCLPASTVPFIWLLPLQDTRLKDVLPENIGIRCIGHDGKRMTLVAAKKDSTVPSENTITFVAAETTQDGAWIQVVAPRSRLCHLLLCICMRVALRRDDSIESGPTQRLCWPSFDGIFTEVCSTSHAQPPSLSFVNTSPAQPPSLSVVNTSPAQSAAT
jgi:hypothetical protein